MQQSFSVGLSTQLALLRRLDTIASNIANQSTAGYRAEEVTFASVVSSVGKEPVAFASTGKTFTSRRQGEVSQTGNPLDVALSGDGWLAVRTPSGVAVTRDGRFRIAPSGELQTITGQTVLDVGGSPIQLNAQGGAPMFARSGAITQDGKSVGAVGVFLVAPDASLQRVGGATFIPSSAPIPSVDPNGPGLLQGHVERSNVEPLRELTQLIELQRKFDAISAMSAQLEGTYGEALRTLGGG
jgi:flagellar basal-body rod protein FlgF